MAVSLKSSTKAACRVVRIYYFQFRLDATFKFIFFQFSFQFRMQLKGKRLDLSRYCSRYVPALKGGWSVARIWQMQGRSEIWTLSEGDIGHCVN